MEECVAPRVFSDRGMEAVTTQWDAWRAAPVSAPAAQAYVDLAVAYGKKLASSEEARYALCPEAMWSHVADVLDAWTAFESEAGAQQRDERAWWANVARAALGVLRNSALDPRHARMMAYAPHNLHSTHIHDVKRWMQTLLVFERMSDPACTWVC